MFHLTLSLILIPCSLFQLYQAVRGRLRLSEALAIALPAIANMIASIAR